MENEETTEGICSEAPGVQLVVQRCESARLLIDNANKWVEIGRGLVVYVSFAKGASEVQVMKAAKTVLQVPLVTEGQWGDGTAPCSVLARCSQGLSCGILVVPQASLTSKVKGKILSYRGQLDKELSRELYEKFVSALSTIASDILVPRPWTTRKPEVAPDDPALFFRSGAFTGKYSQYDDRGVPTHDNNGEELSKSQSKKLERLYFQHAEKYRRFQARFPAETSSSQTKALDSHYVDCCLPMHAENYDTEVSAKAVAAEAEPANQASQCGAEGLSALGLMEAQGDKTPKCLSCVLPDVVAGVFGNRQGFHLTAECGPFTHVFSF